MAAEAKSLYADDTPLMSADRGPTSPKVAVGQPADMTWTGFVYEGIPMARNYAAPPAGTVCRLCGEGCNDSAAIFNPCRCGYVHRRCFKKWRQGWINPRNYFCCPDCMMSYKIERVKASSDVTSAKVVRQYRIKVAMFWLGLLALIGGLIAIFASIAYGADSSDKDIPVAVRTLMMSVVSGYPTPQKRDSWRANFKQPDVAVWPYYTLLGTLITAILILIGFALIGCTFDENERTRRGCCEQCGCNTGGAYYGGCYCYDPCPETNCLVCCECNGCGGGGGGCGSCDCKGGDGGGGGEAIAIIIIVIIAVVLISAVFVIIFYAVKKSSLFHDRMTAMLLAQAEELENETVVLGMGETLRSDDAV